MSTETRIKDTRNLRAGGRPGPDRAASSAGFAQRRAYRQALAIKARYADGQPLDRADRKFILDLLRQHPHGRAKFGIGINAVVPGIYIGGSRCFFLIRPDGTVEDFSIRKCLGIQTSTRTPRIEAMMRAFRYGMILQAYRFRTGLALPGARRTVAGVSR